MSKYTTELRYILERLAGCDESEPYNKISEIIEAARPKLFDFSYPIYDPAYKPVLETKILRHYYTREIGEETYGLFKLRLEDQLNLIMPYYNKLYESALLEYNPLYTVDYTEEHEGSKAGSNLSNKNATDASSSSGSDNRTLNTSLDKTGYTLAETDNVDWTKYSDTPQGGVTGLDNDTYLTNATKDTADDQTKTTYATKDANTGTDNVAHTHTENATHTGSEHGTYNDSDSYVNHVYGHQGGSYAALINEYRETLINIDKLIIDELNDCFMLLY